MTSPSITPTTTTEPDLIFCDTLRPSVYCLSKVNFVCKIINSERMLLNTETDIRDSPPSKRSKLLDRRIEAVVSEEILLPVPLVNVLTAKVKNKKYTSLLGQLVLKTF